MSRKRRLTGEAARKAAFEAVDHAPLLEKLGVEVPEARSDPPQFRK